MERGFKKIIAYCYLKRLSVVAFTGAGNLYLIYDNPDYLAYNFPKSGLIMVQNLKVCSEIIENKFFQVTVGNDGDPHFYTIGTEGKVLKTTRVGGFVPVSLGVIEVSTASLSRVAGIMKLITPKFKTPIGQKEEEVRFFPKKQKSENKFTTAILPIKPKKVDPLTVWVEPGKKESLKNLRIPKKEM